MKGKVQKTEDGWIVKWIDTLHGFGGGGWTPMEAPIHQDDIEGLEEGQEIEFDLEYLSHSFNSCAKLKKFDSNQVNSHTEKELKLKLLDLLKEWRIAWHHDDKARANSLDVEIAEIEEQLDIRERLSK